jgi:hypothetical protein
VNVQSRALAVQSAHQCGGQLADPSAGICTVLLSAYRPGIEAIRRRWCRNKELLQGALGPRGEHTECPYPRASVFSIFLSR